MCGASQSGESGLLTTRARSIPFRRGSSKAPESQGTETMKDAGAFLW